MPKSKVTHYVVYFFEKLQDGTEEGAKVFNNLESAVIQATKWKFDGWPTGNESNCDVRIFELGKEIPLKEEVVEETQPSIKKRKFVL